MDFTPTVLVLLVIVVLGAFGCFLALYLLNAFGLYTMAKNRGLENPWFSFIPLLSRYILGELTGNTMWGIEGSKWLLMIAPLVIFFLTLTIILGIMAIPLSIIYLVYYYMVLFRLYKIYKPESAELYIILSILFNFTISIWIFLIRKNKPHLEALRPDALSNEENSAAKAQTEAKMQEEDIDYYEIKKNIDNINETAKKVEPEKPFELTLHPNLSKEKTRISK